MKDYGLKELDIKDKTKVKATALEMADDGFCTHYGGYTCDKDFPEACPKCIEGWMRRYVKNLNN